MDKKEFMELGNNPEFISGIYNYCDRWCERCAYTSCCFLFATEKQQFPDDDSRDITNQKFWDGMEDLFRITFELLEDAADKFGVGLEEVDSEERNRSEAKKNEQAKQYSAAKKSQEYITKVNSWFEQSETHFEEKGIELAELASLNLPDDKVGKTAAGIRAFIEIIRWYQHQIYIKVKRALRGKIDSLSFDEDPIQTDYNGSAKVALLGVERSIAAWGGLLKMFPDQGDQILQLLVLLQQIRKYIETEFPNSRDFIRPGFDK